MLPLDFLNIIKAQLRMICYPSNEIGLDSLNIGELVRSKDGGVGLVYNLMRLNDGDVFIAYLLMLNDDMTLNMNYIEKNPRGTFTVAGTKNKDRMKQSMLIDDVYSLKTHVEANKNDIDLCPVCGEPHIMMCKCMASNRKCKNGHEWFVCPIHRVPVIGVWDHSKHFEHKCCCKGQEVQNDE